MNMFRFALPSAALVFATLLSAQDQIHKAPHGGILADAGTHQIEMVLIGNEARFYLLDTLGNSLGVEGLSGTAYIQFSNRTTANLEMAPYAKGYLRTMLTSPHSFTMVASVKLPGGFISVQLSSGPRAIPQPVEQHNGSDGHQH